MFHFVNTGESGKTPGPRRTYYGAPQDVNPVGSIFMVVGAHAPLVFGIQCVPISIQPGLLRSSGDLHASEYFAPPRHRLSVFRAEATKQVTVVARIIEQVAAEIDRATQKLRSSVINSFEQR